METENEAWRSDVPDSGQRQCEASDAAQHFCSHPLSRAELVPEILGFQGRGVKHEKKQRHRRGNPPQQRQSRGCHDGVLPQRNNTGPRALRLYLAQS